MSLLLREVRDGWVIELWCDDTTGELIDYKYRDNELGVLK
jgi:hypothetical protein